jgi:hypothetical protein
MDGNTWLNGVKTCSAMHSKVLMDEKVRVKRWLFRVEKACLGKNVAPLSIGNAPLSTDNASFLARMGSFARLRSVISWKWNVSS